MQSDKHSNNSDIMPSMTSASTESSNGSSLLSQPRRKKLIYIGASIAILILVAGSVFVWMKPSSKDNQNNSNAHQTNNQQGQSGNTTTVSTSKFLQQNGQGCKERDVVFSSAPMKMSDLAIIRPLGAVKDGHVTPTDHVYIGAGNPRAADNTYPVLMPADGTIVNVAAMPSEFIGDQNQQTAPEDHRITISHSCRYFSILIHVHKLADALSSVTGKIPPNQSKQVNIELKAGDVIGYIGNATFDWTPLDTTSTLKGYISPELYEGETWKIHTVSPFDLYKEPLKSQLEAKSPRTVAPIGGQIDYDQPGKLVGNWFREGSGGYSGQNSSAGGRYWDGHLAIGPDSIDPASTFVSIGNWTNDTAMQFTVKGSVDPASVSASSGVVKYELMPTKHILSNGNLWDGNANAAGIRLSQKESVVGTIIFQVMDGEKLKVEKFPGKAATQVSGFTSSAQIYER